MSYEEALDYIHHVTWRGSRLGLERTRELLSRIGNPEQSLKFIHIAGTNGKGSTAAMLANILRLSGITQAFTSPPLSPLQRADAAQRQFDFRRRACTDRHLYSALCGSYGRPSTEFELITVIAFEYFHRHRADVVVLEVGMGGALDSTNVIPVPDLAVITNIGSTIPANLGRLSRILRVPRRASSKVAATC
jgi:dihydrofolate synthase/folylpolyglutamate synthase